MHRVSIGGYAVTSQVRGARGAQLTSDFTDNPGDAQNFLQAWQPSPADLRRQTKLATDVAEYKTGGLLQVIPHHGPITLSNPPSWPPIPPAYTPRPGTLVPIPWQESFQPASAPQVQMADRVPVVKRSAGSNRLWFWSNPGVIDNRGLDDTPDETYTGAVYRVPYRAQATSSRSYT